MRAKLIGVVVFCGLLAGCGSPTLLRNPANGAQVQCFAQGAFPLINQQQCISSYEDAGWQRSTPAAAAQADQELVGERNRKIQAAIGECRNEHPTGSMGANLSEAKCVTPKIRNIYARSGFNYMDLIDIMLTSEEVDAEKVDKGELSESEAALHHSEVVSQLTNVAAQRTSQINSQNAATVSQNVVADSARLNALLAIQKQNNDNFNAQQQRQVDIFRAGLASPQAPRSTSTTCTPLGNSVSCTTY